MKNLSCIWVFLIQMMYFLEGANIKYIKLVNLTNRVVREQKQTTLPRSVAKRNEMWTSTKIKRPTLVEMKRYTFRTYYYTQTYIFIHSPSGPGENISERQLKHTQNKQTNKTLINTQRRRFNWYENKTNKQTKKCEEWKRKESKSKQKQTHKQEISERHTNFIWRQFFCHEQVNVKQQQQEQHKKNTTKKQNKNTIK